MLQTAKLLLKLFKPASQDMHFKKYYKQETSLPINVAETTAAFTFSFTGM